MQVSVIEHAASEIRFIILFSHPCSDEFLWSEHSAGNHLKESHFTMLAKNVDFSMFDILAITNSRVLGCEN